MTIEKLKSGSYRISETRNGIRHRVTIPYKPTKKEAFELIQNKINNVQDDMTFKEAADKYIKTKDKVLSPSTITAYKSILKNIPHNFKKLGLTQIDDYELQKLINNYMADHSAKTTHNLHGFVCAVIRLFYPHSSISATLPKKPRHEAYTPTREDVKKILDHADGTPYYVPVYLATLSLRCSEICALTIFDLKGTSLTVNKALVRSDNKYVLKDTPKTDKSNRTIKIPKELAERIREQGYIYKGYPLQITKYLHRAQKELGIPAFGIHRLRHFFASYSHELGYSDAVIQAVGGWSTDNVMKSVYRHAMNEQEAQAKMSEDFSF